MRITRTRRAAYHVRGCAPSLVAACCLMLQLGCSGGESPPVVPPAPVRTVTSVVLTGAPPGFIVVGDTLRLTAAALDASSAVIAGEPVSWSSSTPDVATVSSSGLVQAVGMGPTVITASSGGRSATVAVEVAVSAEIGPAGGVVTAAAGAFRVQFDSNAVLAPTRIYLRQPRLTDADPRVLPGTIFQLGPDTLTLLAFAKVTIGYTTASLGPYARESLRLHTRFAGVWAPSFTTFPVDSLTRTATTLVLGPGVVVLRSVPVDRIVIAGATSGGITIGQSVALSGVLLGTQNDTLPQRPITWSSSAPATISVDATGRITSLAAGSATITATTDGKTATLQLTSVPGSSADWTRAGEWTMAQANAQRTGYIDATVDPSKIAVRWDKYPQYGPMFSAATTAAGHAYVANTGVAAEIDPVSGTVKWFRLLTGAVGYSVTQPTLQGSSLLVATTDGYGQSGVMALAATDGSALWQAPFVSNFNAGQAAVVAGSTVLVPGGASGGVFGFDVASGAQRFARTAVTAGGWTPVVDNGIVYVSDNGIAAINPATGAVTTQSTDARLKDAVSLLVPSAARIALIANEHLVLYNTSTGQVVWDRSGPHQAGGFTAPPVAGNGVIHAITGPITASVVSAISQANGVEQWSWTPPAPYTFVRSMALVNNLLFVSTLSPSGGLAGITYAIDLRTHLPIWSYPVEGNLSISGQGLLWIVEGERMVVVNLR